MNDRNPPTAPILVFAWGNPSRGDDALGPGMLDLIQDWQSTAHAGRGIELLTDFQLQVEHAIDLYERRLVLFIDASLRASAPYEFSALSPDPDIGYTTHAMSPGAVLSVYQRINQQPPPSAFLLSIRGYDFDLGQPLSPRAQDNLRKSFEFVKTLLGSDRTEDWMANVA
ncbi:hydrogenase maturation protease [Thiogranum longum]